MPSRNPTQENEGLADARRRDIRRTTNHLRKPLERRKRRTRLRSWPVLLSRPRYPGRCPSCDERIHEGDSVKYDADGNLIHASCDAPSLPNPRDEHEKVCRQCWTIHNGECL